MSETTEKTKALRQALIKIFIGVSSYVGVIAFLQLCTPFHFVQLYVIIGILSMLFIVLWCSKELSESSPILAGTNHLISILQAIALLSLVIAVTASTIIEDLRFYNGEQKVYVIGTVSNRYDDKVLDSVRVELTYNDISFSLMTQKNGAIKQTPFIIDNIDNDSVEVELKFFKNNTLKDRATRYCVNRIIDISHQIEL